MMVSLSGFHRNINYFLQHFQIFLQFGIKKLPPVILFWAFSEKITTFVG